MTSLPARIISSLTPLWIRRYFIEGVSKTCLSQTLATSSVGSQEKAVRLAKQEAVLSFGQELEQFRQRNKQAVSLSGLLWCNTSIGIPNQDQLAAECLSEVQNTTDGIISIISAPLNSSDSSRMNTNEMHKIFTCYHRQCLSLTRPPRLEDCYERNSKIICHFSNTKETHLIKRPPQRLTYHEQHMLSSKSWSYPMVPVKKKDGERKMRRLTAADVSATLKIPKKMKTV
ncbi:hypothetical protein T02_15259 [Trichinella nativa]|uniref:Uncharacterized protein n=1 Tax=Trichinella nativa TaxID=6335 RepID=A0A0V1L5V9_9BILA|nr:hypothetical protein T02_15259 [Trichinella nativa]